MRKSFILSRLMYTVTKPTTRPCSAPRGSLLESSEDSLSLRRFVPMFSKFLPLIVVIGVLLLALGLLTYHPTPAVAQNRPEDSPFTLFNPVTELGVAQN